MSDFSSIFTKELNEVDARARRIAIRYHHEQIDLAHFLLAFIEDPKESVRDLSTEKDPGLKATQSRIEAFLDGFPRSRKSRIRGRDLRYTRRLATIIHHSRRRATRRGATRISPARLFLALASEDFYSEAERGFVGSRLLSPAGMTPRQIERRLPPHMAGRDPGIMNRQSS
ncbi:MAG: Clp protease N-terminal domain-containing protein [Anaerolineales bacterium]